MANVAFTDLSQLSVIANADKFMVTDDSEAAAEKSKYITAVNLFATAASFVDQQRANFNYSDSNTVTIDAGRYYHAGTTGQMVWWNEQLSYDLSGLGVGENNFIYIDDSAVVSAGTNILTASEFTNSTTAPTWSDAKRGYYNGSDRAIFWVRTDASGDILNFHHDGDFVFFDKEIPVRSSADLDASWTDVTLFVPAVCERALCTFIGYSGGSSTDCIGYWRTDGSTSSGHQVYKLIEASDYIYSQVVVVPTSSKIEIYHGVSGNHEMAVNLNGFYLPKGM